MTAICQMDLSHTAVQSHMVKTGYGCKGNDVTVENRLVSCIGVRGFHPWPESKLMFRKQVRRDLMITADGFPDNERGLPGTKAWPCPCRGILLNKRGRINRRIWGYR